MVVGVVWGVYDLTICGGDITGVGFAVGITIGPSMGLTLGLGLGFGVGIFLDLKKRSIIVAVPSSSRLKDGQAISWPNSFLAS